MKTFPSILTLRGGVFHRRLVHSLDGPLDPDLVRWVTAASDDACAADPCGIIVEWLPKRAVSVLMLYDDDAEDAPPVTVSFLLRGGDPDEEKEARTNFVRFMYNVNGGQSDGEEVACDFHNVPERPAVFTEGLHGCLKHPITLLMPAINQLAAAWFVQPTEDQ